MQIPRLSDDPCTFFSRSIEVAEMELRCRLDSIIITFDAIARFGDLPGVSATEV